MHAHSPHSLVYTRSLRCPPPPPHPYASLSYGSPPGHPAASESKLALQGTDLVEFKAIHYEGESKRRLQFPVPLLLLEWVIRAWEGPTHVKTSLDI